MIQLAATTDEKLHFIDHPSFHNDNGTVDYSLLSEDGLHLSYKGTPTVVNTIMNKIRSIQESSYPSSVIVPSASDDICNQSSDNVVEGPYCYSETVKLFPPAQSNTGKVSAVEPNVRKVSSLRSISKDTKIKQSRTVISKYKYQNNNLKTRPLSENVSRTKRTTVNIKCKTKQNSANQTQSNLNRFCVLKHHTCKTVLSTSECKTRDKKKRQNCPQRRSKKENV